MITDPQTQIFQALAISLMVLFFHVCMKEGHIFEKIPQALHFIPEKLQKPLWGCPICMTPWYGSIIYWIAYQENFLHWIITIFIASGISCIFAYQVLPDDD